MLPPFFPDWSNRYADEWESPPTPFPVLAWTQDVTSPKFCAFLSWCDGLLPLSPDRQRREVRSSLQSTRCMPSTVVEETDGLYELAFVVANVMEPASVRYHVTYHGVRAILKGRYPTLRSEILDLLARLCVEAIGFLSSRRDEWRSEEERLRQQDTVRSWCPDVVSALHRTHEHWVTLFRRLMAFRYTQKVVVNVVLRYASFGGLRMQEIAEVFDVGRMARFANLFFHPQVAPKECREGFASIAWSDRKEYFHHQRRGGYDYVHDSPHPWEQWEWDSPLSGEDGIHAKWTIHTPHDAGDRLRELQRDVEAAYAHWKSPLFPIALGQQGRELVHRAIPTYRMRTKYPTLSLFREGNQWKSLDEETAQEWREEDAQRGKHLQSALLSSYHDQLY